MTEYNFKSSEIESQIPQLSKKGVTEFSVHDEEIAKNKGRVLKIINLIEKSAPDMFVSILVDASIIDKELLAAASRTFCAFEIPLVCSQKGGKLLFDKKFYAGKAHLLNDFGLVFGFQMEYAVTEGDSLKLFMDRLDFALQQYPNHIDFPQIEKKSEEADGSEAKVTGLFSAKDIRYARDLSFACKTYYSAGRAVPWFLSVLKPLKIYPSRFFADFAEWQRCNNCDFKSGFVPEAEDHKSIEKMQLLFTEEKYEEKNQKSLELAVKDIITLNGAMSRLAGENEESTVKTSYNPDDLLGPESFDLNSFVENVCMMECKVRVFAGQEGPDYEIQ